ncbi:hypothetical protein QUF61_15135 [Candidatus Venteria ishoeyi]|uniref:hypothetical protein n=1 Tax=Candidatus Venteria ishoeyi TaxID=1899563 RepID=UPI0025A66143|nr:hypothetical protein [Candidatus Venteria ishoeyi]MDM8547824.1 hypothetical protein [Candidatus Venteria ishoeyi]
MNDPTVIVNTEKPAQIQETFAAGAAGAGGFVAQIFPDFASTIRAACLSLYG